MTKSIAEDLDKLEQNFRELIVQRGKFCGFDKYLKENPEFEFPKITDELRESGIQEFVAVPGMFGGFVYYLEEIDGRPVLYAEQSSRMDYSSDDYSYFEVTGDGSRALGDDERKIVRKKFWELARKVRRVK